MWLNNLKIYTPDGVIERGCLWIKHGKIADVICGPARESGINCNGLAAMPGIIDFHGDMLERELEPRPGVHLPLDLGLYELDKRLAASGVTTAYAAISFAWHAKDTFRTEDRARELIRGVNALSHGLLTDIKVHSRFEITNPDAGSVLLEMLDEQQINLVSIMDHTPGQGQYRDIERYIHFAMEWRRKKMGKEVTEEEMRQNVIEAQQRPKAWNAVEEISRITRETGVPFASHDDDTPEKVAMVAELGATVSEFPVTREAAKAARDRGMHTVMGAPNALRGSSHSGNLSAAEAIAEDLVDLLAADYYPMALLQAIYSLEQRGIKPVSESFKLITQNPADALSLCDRGRLETGYQADVTLVQEGERARVRATLRDGLPIYWDHHMARLDGVDLDRGHWKDDDSAMKEAPRESLPLRS